MDHTQILAKRTRTRAKNTHARTFTQTKAIPKHANEKTRRDVEGISTPTKCHLRLESKTYDVKESDVANLRCTCEVKRQLKSAHQCASSVVFEHGHICLREFVFLWRGFAGGQRKHTANAYCKSKSTEVEIRFCRQGILVKYLPLFSDVTSCGNAEE